ncbi:MAG: hypothetical protein IKI95_04535 [Clostridia bacterium]|nr:hypothetical protein [Clostridia bacterium]
MSEPNDNNKRKTKLIIVMLIAIITVLLAGIVYQFVVIKKLENKIENNTNSCVKVVENNHTNEFLKY